MPISLQTLKNFNNNRIFVETGSHIGDGIQLAIDAKFETIISIEILEVFHNICVERFKSNNNVKLYIGDSSEMLWEIVKDINKTITFWLDGHYPSEKIPKGKYLSPLIQELDHIQRHPIKLHTILIDDMRCWNNFNNKYHNNFDISSIVQKIKQINPLYQITFTDGMQVNGEILSKDIMVAKI